METYKFVTLLQIYRFARVPFGVISSPFLLGATVAHHLEKKVNPVAEKIQNNIYVDNVITGMKTPAEAYQFYVEAKNIFQEASMNLREWMSSSAEFLSMIPECDKAHGENVKVLGVRWNPKGDTLTITAPNTQILNAVDTNRKLLQAVAMIFNPLGYFSPIILAAKLLLQKLWINGIDWDEHLSSQYLCEWKAVAIELEKISMITIPRFIRINEITKEMSYYLLLRRLQGCIFYNHIPENFKPRVPSKLVVGKMSLTTEERNNFASFRALGNFNWLALS